MSKLTTNQRNNLPTSAFAGPGRTYPIPDRAHAAVAKGRAVQQGKAGNLAPAEVAKVITAANKKLGK